MCARTHMEQVCLENSFHNLSIPFVSHSTKYIAGLLLIGNSKYTFANRINHSKFYWHMLSCCDEINKTFILVPHSIIKSISLRKGVLFAYHAINGRMFSTLLPQRSNLVLYTWRVAICVLSLKIDSILLVFASINFTLFTVHGCCALTCMKSIGK